MTLRWPYGSHCRGSRAGEQRALFPVQYPLYQINDAPLDLYGPLPLRPSIMLPRGSGERGDLSDLSLSALPSLPVKRHSVAQAAFGTAGRLAIISESYRQYST